MKDFVVVNEEAVRELVREVAREEVERARQQQGSPGRLLTPGEVAELWGCSVRTVNRQLLDGVLPGVRIGRNWRVRWQDAVR